MIVYIVTFAVFIVFDIEAVQYLSLYYSCRFSDMYCILQYKKSTANTVRYCSFLPALLSIMTLKRTNSSYAVVSSL